MKRILKLLTVAMTMATLLCAMAIPAFATGSVTYDGNANKFIFAPGGEESSANLFDNFQDMMPGDTRTEQILIKNDTSNKVKIKVYMRALGAQEGTENFLSQLKLTVQQADESVLFAAPADETAQLTDWVYLGTIYSGGEIPLDVTLEVPITMGNEYQNKIGYIDWQFKVDEIPIEPGDPYAPKTGDTGEVFVYSCLLVVSLTAFIVMLILSKRKN